MYLSCVCPSDPWVGGGGGGDVVLPPHHPQLPQQGAQQALQHTDRAPVHCAAAPGILYSVHYCSPSLLVHSALYSINN